MTELENSQNQGRRTELSIFGTRRKGQEETFKILPGGQEWTTLRTKRGGQEWTTLRV
jgi:hypothetical protein